MTEIIIETERLKFIRITPTFIHHLFNTKSKEEIKTYFDFDDQGFEKYQDMHEKGMETYQLSFLFFLLVDKQSNLPIGECGFHTWNKKHNRAELFYFLKADEHKRKGFMTEAIPVILRYGFEQMDLHRVEALIAAWNEPSLKLVNKFNFVKEGVMREDYFDNGRHEDSTCYSLLVSEYKSSL